MIESYQTVKEKLEKFLNETEADEIMINSQIFNHEDRLRSFEIVHDMINGQKEA